MKSHLAKLRKEAGIDVPEERTVIANLYLALTAMQWSKLQSGHNLSITTEQSLKKIIYRKFGNDIPEDLSLKDILFLEAESAFKSFVSRFTKVSEETIYKYSEPSGWSEVRTIFNKLDRRYKALKQIKFTNDILDYLTSYLERYPTLKDEYNRINNTNILNNILDNFFDKRDELRMNMETKIKDDELSIFSEFCNYLTDERNLSNLQSNIEAKVKGEIHYSALPNSIKYLVKDHIKSRCGVWVKDFNSFNTSKSEDAVKGKHDLIIRQFKNWIGQHKVIVSPNVCDTAANCLELEFTSTPNPDRLISESFLDRFCEWIEPTIEETFNENWWGKCLTLGQEVANETGYQARRFVNSIRGFFTNKKYETKKKPSFNQNEAIQNTRKGINDIFNTAKLNEIYREGKGKIISDSTQSELPSSERYINTSIILGVVGYGIKLYKEKQLDSHQSKCKNLYYIWQNECMDCMTKSVNESFTNWSKANEQNLEIRKNNLESGKKSLAQDHVREIYNVVNLIHEINFSDRDFKKNINTFKKNINTVHRLIDARRIKDESTEN
ncbi:MAG: hypothetical protein AAGE84_16520 [Cyanobacteria bacterium P01_G01_bin.39]